MDDPSQYLRFVLSLGAVLALMLGGAWLLRRSGFAALARSSRHRGRRLAITEILPIDPRHRLVLVRRDNVEHLILMSEGRHLLIESAIPPARPEADASDANADSL